MRDLKVHRVSAGCRMVLAVGLRVVLAGTVASAGWSWQMVAAGLARGAVVARVGWPHVRAAAVLVAVVGAVALVMAPLLIAATGAR
ncbi:hypothetical protein [Actinomadura litoris]|uniref:hypothetical protein n=1 Tax=Actinomadura litoris TaxID=2678616 RepID=UPI0023431EAD|nr:hypothetical protein [Actinomadura litoris]